MNRLAPAALCLAFLVACSQRSPDPAPRSAEDPPTPSEATEAAAEPSPDEQKRSRERRARHGRDPGSARTGGDGGRARAGGGASTPRRERRFAYPAAGSYVYAQTGYEEFCQGPGTNCERSDLPDEQQVRMRYRQRSRERATVVAESFISKHRYTRTRYAFGPKRAAVQEVYTRFDYASFNYEKTYRPDPPVHALRFPLEAGMSWESDWDASVSGTYRAEVTSTDRLAVQGRRVDAFRIDTSTDFSGEFEGEAEIVLWVDADTKTVVASKGFMDVRSTFGTFETRFELELERGSAYR